MGGVGSGAQPKQYPLAVVERVRELYMSGHTIREIQQQVKGVKVQNVISRNGIATRPAVKRDQTGSANSSWRGDDAGYQALHLRVETARGKPRLCNQCGADSPGRYEWANITGDYANVADYQRMCVPCHRTFDATRRAETGERTSPVRR